MLFCGMIYQAPRLLRLYSLPAQPHQTQKFPDSHAGLGEVPLEPYAYYRAENEESHRYSPWSQKLI